MLQSYYSLYRGNGLLVLHLFKNATGLLLVCEHALGIGLKLLLRNIVHSVHCELICSKTFCAREQICLLYLHAELVHKEAAYKLPAIVLDKEAELLLDFLHGELTFVGGVNPPLHECLREFEVSLFHEIVTNILREAEVSLVGVLGSEPLGLIMARRMTLEGAKVLCVAELMPYSGGLKRNIVQCLDDFDIPLKLSHTVVDIQGKERVTGITIAQVENGKPIPGTEEHYDCDTLLLSCGLLPENELSRAAGVALSPITGGPSVNESLETNIPGVFAAGNVLHVHDLVDYVSEEAGAAGEHAAAYILKSEHAAGRTLPVRCENGVRYTVPTAIRPDCAGDTVTLRFRVGGVYKNKKIAVYLGDTCIFSRRRPVLAPGEMETVRLKSDLLRGAGDAVTVTLEEG